MAIKMWALVDKDDGGIILIERTYWTIINQFKARTAVNFYRQNPKWRIKRCTVTIP
jgi:hypothetical protein